MNVIFKRLLEGEGTYRHQREKEKKRKDLISVGRKGESAAGRRGASESFSGLFSSKQRKDTKRGEVHPRREGDKDAKGGMGKCKKLSLRSL